MPPDASSGLLEQIAFFFAACATWIAGEAGRAFLAGVSGGFVRWLMADRRKLRDGAVSVVAGGLMSLYASPLMLVVLERWFGALSGDAAGAAGFAAGLAGMSLAKLILGAIDAHARRMGGTPNA